MRLTDKVAIVTGAGRGIGCAIAKIFSGEGAGVVVDDLDFGNAAGVAGEINAGDGSALAVKVDVTEKKSVEAMVKAGTRYYCFVEQLPMTATGKKVHYKLARQVEEDHRRGLLEKV